MMGKRQKTSNQAGGRLESLGRFIKKLGKKRGNKLFKGKGIVREVFRMHNKKRRTTSPDVKTSETQGKKKKNLVIRWKTVSWCAIRSDTSGSWTGEKKKVAARRGAAVPFWVFLGFERRRDYLEGDQKCTES